MKWCLLSLAAAFLVGSPARAQEGFPVGPGSRVRVTAPSVGERLEGYVQSVDASTLTLLSAKRSAVVTVPLSTLTRLEVPAGRRGHALVGGIVGGALGAVTVAALCSESSDCIDSAGDVGAAAGVTAVYAGVGALIGALIRSDRWIVVPARPATARLAPRPGRGVDVGVAFRIAF